MGSWISRVRSGRLHTEVAEDIGERGDKVVGEVVKDGLVGIGTSHPFLGAANTLLIHS